MFSNYSIKLRHTYVVQKNRIAVFAAFLLVLGSLTSCGVVEVDNGCVMIKKLSEEKRQIGTTFLEMADSGKIGEGLTFEEVQTEGYRYLLEGIQLVVDNPQCFTKDEVKIAKNLLGQ